MSQEEELEQLRILCQKKMISEAEFLRLKGEVLSGKVLETLSVNYQNSSIDPPSAQPSRSSKYTPTLLPSAPPREGWIAIILLVLAWGGGLGTLILIVWTMDAQAGSVERTQWSYLAMCAFFVTVFSMVAGYYATVLDHMRWYSHHILKALLENRET